MKIAYISRATLYSSPGGDTQQIAMTAHYLRELGVDVDIYLTTDKINYHNYDLLHFFNIIRPADILRHILRSEKPYVVSTIFLDYGDFEKNGRRGWMKWMNKIFSEDQIEYNKAIARRVRNGEKIGSWHYLRWGHRRSIHYIAENAGMLLPNSVSEYKRFSEKYQLQQVYQVIPNGIDPNLITKSDKPRNEQCRDAVLCVGRIEGRKNQINLIRALNNTQYKVYIIGKPSPNNMAYYKQCKEAAADNIVFSNWVSEEKLYEMYHSAKVHILPSYFETTGLSTLEAAVMGCNIVITDKGDTVDYFGDYAWYCNPDDPASIRKAVDDAYSAPYNNRFKEYILNHYTWEHAAKEALEAYKKVLRPCTFQLTSACPSVKNATSQRLGI